MIRTLNGFHFPNAGFDASVPDALRATAPEGGCVMLDTVFEQWYPRLRQQMGTAFGIGLRFYPEGGWPDPTYGRHWNEVPPTVWAAECCRRLMTVPGAIDDPYLIVSPANEQDLSVEGHPGAAGPNGNNVPISVYNEIWTWQAEWVIEMQNRLPHGRFLYGTAPLAGGHEPTGTKPDSEYQLWTFRRLAGMVDVIWAHAYVRDDGWGWHPSNGGYRQALRPLRPVGFEDASDLGGIANQYPDKPILLSEFGNWHHFNAAVVPETMQQFNSVYQSYADSGRCLLVAPFIWDSEDEHWQNRIARDGVLVEALRDMHRYPAAAWPQQGGGQEMSQLEAILRDVWKRQGVDVNPEDSFWKYALAQVMKGRLIYPMPSSDGNYYTPVGTVYVAYTNPPLWCPKASPADVKEGLPPLS